ncbi:protein phosphatase 2C domain-containing protein [Nostoc sp. CHAB 5834]|nr:protein phosphatase 2C domain-containing protein [Nostoc sp. CHAB 5834]
MHTDFAQLTGSSHIQTATPSQDYCAVRENGANAWAGVSDGCSTGGHTDKGARAWLAALEQVMAGSVGTLMRRADLQNSLLAAIDRFTPGLMEADLLATVGVLQVAGTQCLATLMGDGVLMLRHHNQDISMYSLQYSENAPNYLSYNLSPLMAAAYDKQYGGQTRTVNHYRFDESGAALSMAMESAEARDAPWELAFDAERDEVELAVIATDGIASTAHGLHKAVMDVMSVKSPAGAFLKRRLGKLARTWPNEHLMPTDDLAIAGAWLLRG